MERARRLVAASGRAGERVAVHAPAFRAPVARYYASLLHDLGFRATLSIEPDNYDNYRRSLQTGFTGWLIDSSPQSTFLEDNFACAATGAGESTSRGSATASSTA